MNVKESIDRIGKNSALIVAASALGNGKAIDFPGVEVLPDRGDFIIRTHGRKFVSDGPDRSTEETVAMAYQIWKNGRTEINELVSCGCLFEVAQ